MTLRLRGMSRGASLRELARKERALLYEDFSNDAQDSFFSRWVRGPSIPPPDRPSYRALETIDTGDGTGGPSGDTNELLSLPPDVGSSFVDLNFLLCPGCRAIVKQQASRHDGWEVILLQLIVMHWSVKRVDPFGTTFKVQEGHLRLIYHPRWDLSPRRHLRLEGGWRMNFSGVMRTFERRIKPKRVSFMVRLNAGCSKRSFFNVFLSSNPEAYSDNPVFYCGTPWHPPSPVDVLSLLFDVHEERRARAHLWLPSGYNALEDRDDAAGVGTWQRITMDFDWNSMQMLCFNGQVIVRPTSGGV